MASLRSFAKLSLVLLLALLVAPFCGAISAHKDQEASVHPLITSAYYADLDGDGLFDDAVIEGVIHFYGEEIEEIEAMVKLILATPSDKHYTFVGFIEDYELDEETDSVTIWYAFYCYNVVDSPGYYCATVAVWWFNDPTAYGVSNPFWFDPPTGWSNGPPGATFVYE